MIWKQNCVIFAVSVLSLDTFSEICWRSRTRQSNCVKSRFLIYERSVFYFWNMYSTLGIHVPYWTSYSNDILIKRYQMTDSFHSRGEKKTKFAQLPAGMGNSSVILPFGESVLFPPAGVLQLALFLYCYRQSWFQWFLMIRIFLFLPTATSGTVRKGNNFDCRPLLVFIRVSPKAESSNHQAFKFDLIFSREKGTYWVKCRLKSSLIWISIISLTVTLITPIS